MRTMEFKMERPGLLELGEQVKISEGILPSNYYYIIEPSLAMSANFPFHERLLKREGMVKDIKQNERGYYVSVVFSDEKV